jgi:HD-like signal output (HDOD) protein
MGSIDNAEPVGAGAMHWEDLKGVVAVGDQNLDEIFAHLEVPELPSAASHLLKVLRDTEVAPADLARIITTDPGITARILRLVNSAHIGLPQQVADVRLAVSLLGVKRIQSLVLGFSAKQVLPAGAPELDDDTFWRDSIQRAAFAEAVAGKIARNGEGEAFTGALLQDLAHPVLVRQWADVYLPILARAAGGRNLIEVEREELSWTHAETGAWIARQWGLPETLVCCVGLHHAGPEALAELGLTRSPIAAVAASARVPDAWEFCSGIGLSPEDFRDICDKTNAACASLASLFGVTKPGRLIALRKRKV